jgi:hypothetical protein
MKKEVNMPKKTRYFTVLLRVVVLLALLLPLGLVGTAPLTKDARTALAAPLQQAPTTDTIALSVVSARTEPRAFDGAGVLKGDPVTAYKFMINVDNTGDPTDDPLCFAATNPNYPDGCDWPSIRTVPGWSPIYAQGDETALNETITLAGLPPGKYLISVMADGYKLDGEHFTIPMEETTPGSGVATIEVAMHPLPLPPATMVIKVFEDVSMTNGQYDAPSEDGNPLEGFRVSLNDIAGEITADLFGNPLCTEYEKDPVTGEVLLDADGAPIILNLGLGCYSDANGIVTIPNIGPLRYDVLMFPPAGETWIQTTTLEGSQGWDTWLQEAGTGLDNEFLIAAEPFPWTIFGFVRPNTPNLGGTGTIQGVIMGAATFVPTTGGLPYIGDTFGGLGGALLHRPIANPWLSLNDLQNGDTAVWVGQGNADGTFSIPNVPEGNYILTYWDENQHYILDLVQVTVNANQTTDLGIRMLTGWFTEVSGYVYHDENSNGVRDPGEQGMPDYLVVLRDRDNTEIDRMSIAALTDANGFYELEKGYPMGSWMVLEAYSDLHHTTGVTYQTLNMPAPKTLMGGIVDIGLLPVLGQPVQLDWGVHLYDSNENGGIAGTVFYDTVRAEDEARYAGVEPWQPGIPDLTMNLYAAQVDAFGQPVLASDGSYAKGQLLATTTTETFARPKDCIARDADGIPLDPAGFTVLPDPTAGKDCLEGPLMGTQIGDGQNNLDGNWGFGEGCYGAGNYATGEGTCAIGTPTPLIPGNYLVEVEIPNDASGNPMFLPTREEDLNMFDGDTFIPNIPPPACAGPLHIVDLADAGPDNMPARYNVLQVSNNATGGTFTLTANGQETTGAIPFDAPASWIEIALESLDSVTSVTVTGAGTSADPWVITFLNPVVGELTADDIGLSALGSASTIVADPSHTITVPASTPVVNPNHAAEYDAGFGRYEGDAMPLCDVKYVQLSNGKAVAPVFNLFTPVPIPGKWKGYLIDNLNVSVDPATLFFGEMAGIPNAPIGLYDYSGRLVHTTHSDFNGVYETLLPSTGTYNAPTPSGMLANVYYLYANDPGPLDAPNLNYNPQYRSIGTSFEIYPGTINPSDLAPTQNGAAIWAPGALFNGLALCAQPDTDPQLYAVSKPYGSAGELITIQGIGFGGAASVTLDGIPVATTTPTEADPDRVIEFTVPAGTVGPKQLLIEANGLTTVNGLTFHIWGRVPGNRYEPNIYEVGPDRTYDPANYDGTAGGPIQAAIDAAWASGGNQGHLVVVYPGVPVPMINPLGMYIENPVIYAPVKLQGVGPGGTYPDAAAVPGAIIDGRAVGGDSPYNLWWRQVLIPEIWNNRGGWDRGLLDAEGNPSLYEGAVITVFGEKNEFRSSFVPAVDGFIIQGGDQQGFPNNINQVGGGAIPGVQPQIVVQGGGIFVDGYGDYMRISNNLIQTNGGAYGGAIRLGTPNVPEPLTDNHNDNVVIAHNRILANGGTNLAGAIGLFAGADAYQVSHNDICGNASIEYGGGVSHYGYSPDGQIHHNRIIFNSSADEGGGIMIAGELPADPTVLSPGAGPVDIYNNLLQSNLSNDDGGGLRFLMAGDYPYNVYNNMIVNNVSTHEGGGVSLNDAPDVRIMNNTIMENVTTATALTSDGQAAPAGVASSRNSALLQATLKRRAPVFSNPLLFNNVFWHNRAGSLTPQGVVGIGLIGDTSPINYWDLGVGDGSGLLSPTYSSMQTTQGTVLHASNILIDPLVVQSYLTEVSILAWRGNPNFVGTHISVVDLPVPLPGDYHLQPTSPVIDRGTTGVATNPVISAPGTDFDDEPRPSGTGFDIGADEVQLAP